MTPIECRMDRVPQESKLPGATRASKNEKDQFISIRL